MDLSFVTNFIKSKKTWFIGSSAIWIIFLIQVGCAPEDNAEENTGTTQKEEQLKLAENIYIGDQKCQSCHSDQHELWKKSDHFLAMQAATPEYVKGDFNNTHFKKGNTAFNFKVENNQYVVYVTEKGEKEKRYLVSHTFGHYPLQQYLIPLDKGRLQCLTIAWDSKTNQWMDLYPEQDIAAWDWMHWTNGAMTWNTMCADCHSTNLQKNYDFDTDSFNTTWDIINVSCEACHGPGKSHIDYIDSEDYKAGKKKEGSNLMLTASISSEEQVHQCAPCHSRRVQIGAYQPDTKYYDAFYADHLRENLYHADGQILDEVYVYGSFVQSKMYHNDVRCTDCHDPHTAKIKFEGNRLCLQCHEAPKYDVQEHLIHPKGTTGAECINCHMPGKHYMVNDFRRDHSFRIPRPDLSVEYGTPNACNSCHTDKDPQWAAKVVDQKYGTERPYHYAETLAAGRKDPSASKDELIKLAKDLQQPFMARATAIYYLGANYNDPEVIQTIAGLLKDKHPLVRHKAVEALPVLSEQALLSYAPIALTDPAKSVRVMAAQALKGRGDQLSPKNKKAFEAANREYQQALMITADFPAGRYNLGTFYHFNGATKKALAQYQKALEMDSLLVGARVNLAMIYNQLGKNEQVIKEYETVLKIDPTFTQAYYSMGLVYAEMGDLPSAATALAKAKEYQPENERIFYNLGIIYQNLGQIEQSKKVYLEGIQNHPTSIDIHYALVTLLMQQEEWKEAQKIVLNMQKLSPQNPQVQQLIQEINKHL